MKNTLHIRREFGEVIIKAALPSVEDVCRKMSAGATNNIFSSLSATNRAKFYCAELPSVYTINTDDPFGDFNNHAEEKGLFVLANNWGDLNLYHDNYLNIVPFISLGIGTEKTLKFQGIYSEESLMKVKKTLEAFVNFLKGYRKSVSFSFEITEDEADTKEEKIKL
jgi:hypothetical protein